MRLLKWFAGFLIVLAVLLAMPAVYIHAICRDGGIPVRPADTRQAGAAASIVDALRNVKDWRRPEADSFLTYPEWYIVYASQDYGRYLARHSASGFRYFASAFGYWTSYCEMNRYVTRRYQFSTEAHITDYVIGISHSAEFILRGIYENTIGRLTELLAVGPTAEEKFAQGYWTDYGNFLNTTPWYSYPFADRQRELWRAVDRNGPGTVRKWERRIALATEFWIKGAYAGMIGGGTKAAFAPVVPITVALVEKMPPEIMTVYRQVKLFAQSGDVSLVSFPRYTPFTEIVSRMAATSARFVEIAGNRDILITVMLRNGVSLSTDRGVREIFRTDMLAGDGGSRVGIAVPVEGLLDLIRDLKRQGAIVEHIYDY